MEALGGAILAPGSSNSGTCAASEKDIEPITHGRISSSAVTRVPEPIEIQVSSLRALLSSKTPATSFSDPVNQQASRHVVNPENISGQSVTSDDTSNALAAKSTSAGDLRVDPIAAVGPRTCCKTGTVSVEITNLRPVGLGVFPGPCTFRSRAHPTLLLSSFFKNQLQIQYDFNCGSACRSSFARVT